MTDMIRRFACLLACALAVASSAAAQSPEIALWPAGAPGALGGAPEDTPAITPFPAPAGRATGAAVVIFPGGGYQHLSSEKEGSVVARWLNSLGVSAFVVRYRLGPKYRHPTMLHDARRAVRLVRARAAEWGVDPRRIGVLGFSAGGHMASTAATHFAPGEAASPDPVERVSSRPDLAVLVYPVITMDSTVAHAGSRRNLLGTAPPPDLVRLMSNETRVTRETPPTFIVASTDDATVPVENSIRMYQALRAAAVPVELHVFESGRHGWGTAPGDPVLSSWLGQCELWLGRHGWVTPTKVTK